MISENFVDYRITLEIGCDEIHGLSVARIPKPVCWTELPGVFAVPMPSHTGTGLALFAVDHREQGFQLGAALPSLESAPTQAWEVLLGYSRGAHGVGDATEACCCATVPWLLLVSTCWERQDYPGIKLSNCPLWTLISGGVTGGS